MNTNCPLGFTPKWAFFIKIGGEEEIKIKKFLAGLGILSLVLALAAPVWAADEQGVTATVTVQNISITVSDGSVAYGTLSVNTSKDTTSGDLNDSQIATNNGNITENFNIKGSDSANWTLSGSAGTDQYVHEFCRGDTGDCDGTPTFTALTTSYTELDTGVTVSGTQDFDLRITTPTLSGNFDQQSVNVTVQAVAI